MKRFLRLLFARLATYVLMLLVLSGVHSLVRADVANIDVCGRLIQGYCSLIEVQGEYYEELYAVDFGDFNDGDYVHVIGTVECISGPSPCMETNCFIRVNSMSLCNTVWYIEPDGSGDHLTIQAGIDASEDGYTILLANGIFSGPGNRDIDFNGKAITVRSSWGNPNSCIIDCEGSEGDPHRGFYFHSGEGPGSELLYVTIKNGYYEEGGGVRCDNSSPTFTNCKFSYNSTPSNGGGMYCVGSFPTLTNCTFSGNSTAANGGGMYCESSSPTLSNCTFSDNLASSGGGMYSVENSSPTLEKTIITFGTQGEAVYCDSSSSATLICCDVYGNAGGDWVGCIADQNGINDNFSLDPLFCVPPGSSNVSLLSISPCAPPRSPCGTLIGALGVGCRVTGQLIQCPSDLSVPVFPDTRSLVLEGFAITNIAPIDLVFDYYLVSEGPATLVDNGDPTSLSGTTPVLPPGESFSPPEASLDIPAISEYSQESVTYYVSAVGYPEIIDSCTTVITFEPEMGQSADSMIVAWGDSDYGRCNIPQPNAGFVAVEASSYGGLGLKSDGTIVAWGHNSDVPIPNADFVAISGRSNHCLGLKSDGTIVAWGRNNDGQCDVPIPNAGFIAIEVGRDHSLGLKSDGTIVAWGKNADGQCNIPSPNANFVGMSGGNKHSLGLKSDGTIAAWGRFWEGQCNVPSPNADFIAVAAGGHHSLGLKSDGMIVVWGDDGYGQRNVPSPNADFIAIRACYSHCLGLKSDGTITAWGDNEYGQCNVPSPNADFIAVAGGSKHSLGLRRFGPAVVCPSDMAIPAFSTIDTLVLDGFMITNILTFPTIFDYFVTADGPAMLVDNGDPTSLSGTTPQLSLGESFEPPDAALVVPAIRTNAQEIVTYNVTAVENTSFMDSCTTVITFDPPVPALVSAFDAVSGDRGVELTWDIISDEDVKGFRIYRCIEDSQIRELVNPDGLLALEMRKYVDCDVDGGRAYEYTLGVVLADDSEVISQTITVKTRAHVLALFQNHPNPFNPSTTISFTLPKRTITKLAIYNVEGKLVKTLVDGILEDGYQEILWDGKDAHGNFVSSGVYFYRLKAGGKTLTKKMVLLK